jgi:hypothetical protein
MIEEDAFDTYGNVPLHFSHYYNFIFVYKSSHLDDGNRIFLHLGGCMEKVSAMVVDVEDPLTLEGKAEEEYAFIKNKENQVIWKHGNPIED